MQETSVDREQTTWTRDSICTYTHQPSDTWHTPESTGRAKLFIDIINVMVLPNNIPVFRFIFPDLRGKSNDITYSSP